MYCRAP